MKTLSLLLVLSILAQGCDGDSGSSPPAEGSTPAASGAPASDPSSPAAAPGGAWDPASGTAAIHGTVKFSGEAPRRRPIDMGADAKCKALHESPLTDESIIVNDNATLANSFVWIKSGLDGIRFPAPTEPKRLSQKGCRYVPHVQGIQVKQPLIIQNNDPFLHNVHSRATSNTAFNFGQSTQGAEQNFRFRRQEVMVKVKCDVHGWMSSFIGVVEHPFFAVTDDKGAFELKGLPPGKYTVEAWHEVLGTKTVEVRLTDNENKEIDFTFEE